jgi:hypothetical protein
MRKAAIRPKGVSLDPLTGDPPAGGEPYPDCPVCRALKAKLDRLERNHAEKVRIRKESWHAVLPTAHRRLRSAENEAMLRLEITRAELNQHRRDEHGSKR